MPWSKSDLPDAAKNLTSKEKEIFVEVANSMLEDGKSEEAAIRGGLSQAKKLNKSEGFAQGLAVLIEKYFGGSDEDHEPQIEQENVSEETHVAKAVDIEKQHFTSVVLRPDVPDLHGDIYDASVVEDACHEYNELCQKANLQHLFQTDLATPIESYIAKSDFKLGEGEVKAGDWVMTMKVKDSELWQMCKNGTFTGFSVGCTAHTEAIND